MNFPCTSPSTIRLHVSGFQEPDGKQPLQVTLASAACAKNPPYFTLFFMAPVKSRIVLGNPRITLLRTNYYRGLDAALVGQCRHGMIGKCQDMMAFARQPPLRRPASARPFHPACRESCAPVLPCDRVCPRGRSALARGAWKRRRRR